MFEITNRGSHAHFIYADVYQKSKALKLFTILIIREYMYTIISILNNH